MLPTRKCRWLRSLSLYAAVLALALALSCSRKLGLANNDGTGQSDPRDLPFHGDADAGGAGETASRVPDQSDSSSNALLFNSAPPHLPAGALLTVRLQSTLITAKPDGGKTFRAVVEDPVTIEGRTVIPRDAEVKGRVESARVSDAVRRRTGYLRLTLDSVRVGDRDVALSTSSLFARAMIASTSRDSATQGSRARSIANRPGVVSLQKGRRLTFRLTAPLVLGQPVSADDKGQSGTK